MESNSLFCPGCGVEISERYNKDNFHKKECATLSALIDFRRLKFIESSWITKTFKIDTRFFTKLENKHPGWFAVKRISGRKLFRYEVFLEFLKRKLIVKNDAVECLRIIFINFNEYLPLITTLTTDDYWWVAKIESIREGKPQ